MKAPEGDQPKLPKTLFCSCGAYWIYSREDAEAHARLYGHTLTEIDRQVKTVELPG